MPGGLKNVRLAFCTEKTRPARNYGTTYAGGTNSNGAIFSVSTNGNVFKRLYSFTALDPDTGTNKDGANPGAGLILSGNTLYGTASAGGSGGYGTVFAINTNGTGFTSLHGFPPGISDQLTQPIAWVDVLFSTTSDPVAVPALPPSRARLSARCFASRLMPL